MSTSTLVLRPISSPLSPHAIRSLQPIQLNSAQLSNNQRFTVGRGGATAKPNVLISDKRISRIHCNISYDHHNHTFMIENYSKNGIWFNEQLASNKNPVPLNNNDVVAFTSDMHADTIGQIKYNVQIITHEPPDTTIPIITDNTMQSTTNSQNIKSDTASVLTEPNHKNDRSITNVNNSTLPIPLASNAINPSIIPSITQPHQYYIFHIGNLHTSVDQCNNLLHELSDTTKSSGPVVSFDANALVSTLTMSSTINLPYTVLHLIDCLLYGIDRISYTACLTYRADVERQVLNLCKSLNDFILSLTPTPSQIAATLRLDNRITHLRDADESDIFIGAASRILLTTHQSLDKLQRLHDHQVDCIVLYTRPSNDDNNGWLISVVTNSASVSKCHILQPLIMPHQQPHTYATMQYATQSNIPLTTQQQLYNSVSIDPSVPQQPNTVINSIDNQSEKSSNSRAHHSHPNTSTVLSPLNSTIQSDSQATSHIDQLKQYNVPTDLINTQTIKSSVLSPGLSSIRSSVSECTGTAAGNVNGGNISKRNSDSPITQNKKRTTFTTMSHNNQFDTESIE